MILAVLICEDECKQREHMACIVNDYIALKDYDIELALSTDRPADLLDYVRAHPQQHRLYILDVHLGPHEMNGITLAKQIRALDPFGKLVFVTTHTELAHLTFKYHIEAMDYIIKDDMHSVAQQVQACVELTYKRCLDSLEETEYFQLKTSGGILKIPIDDIISFESCQMSNKKLILYTMCDRFEFRGTLKEVVKKNAAFCHCHKSYIVNTKNIKGVTRLSAATGKAEMVNGAIVQVNKANIVPLKKFVMAQAN